MTRERAKELLPVIAAYSEGKDVEFLYYGTKEWVRPIGTPMFDGASVYRIKPKPRTRPMTRGEVLYMVTTTPAMVLRHGVGLSVPAQYYELFESSIDDIRYAIIDKTGAPVDGWHKFEVTE